MIQLIYLNAVIVTMPMGHLPWHTPAKHGPNRWKIVDCETSEVIDSYSPPPKVRHRPITQWEGSWAQSMKEKRDATT